jgi:2-C-methyl-D-erythritol 4-phosphate cytidylyltransferase
VVRTPERAGGDATDDASLVEANGGRVRVVEGAPENFKVTTPLDVRVAEMLLAH